MADETTEGIAEKRFVESLDEIQGKKGAFKQLSLQRIPGGQKARIMEPRSINNGRKPISTN